MNITKPLSRNSTRAAFTAALCIAALGMPASAAAQTASGQKGTSSQSTTSGGAGDAAMSSAGGTASTTITPEDRRFIEKAAMSGLKEVRLARLATERAGHPEVRDYAQMLLTEHQQANATLATLARHRGIDVPGEGVSTRTAATPAGTTVVATRESSAGTASQPRTVVGGQSGVQAPAGGTASSRAGQASGSGPDSARDEALQSIEAEAAKLGEKTGAEFDRAYVRGMIKDHKEAIGLFEAASERKGDAEVSDFAAKTLPKLRAHLSRAESLSARVNR